MRLSASKGAVHFSAVHWKSADVDKQFSMLDHVRRRLAMCMVAPALACGISMIKNVIACEKAMATAAQSRRRACRLPAAKAADRSGLKVLKVAYHMRRRLTGFWQFDRASAGLQVRQHE